MTCPRALRQGTFIEWFSASAFGGTSHANTPVGAVTYVDEPQLERINDPSTYFDHWASGKRFSVAAWHSRKTPFFMAVGDPLVTR